MLCSEEEVNIGTVTEEIDMEGEVIISIVALAAVDEVTGLIEVRTEPHKSGRRELTEGRIGWAPDDNVLAVQAVDSPAVTGKVALEVLVHGLCITERLAAGLLLAVTIGPYMETDVG